MNENGGPPSGDSDPWPRADESIARLVDLHLRQLFSEGLSRQREIMATLTRMDRAGERRDQKLTTIAQSHLALERQMVEQRAQLDLAIALMHGIAATVARTEDERQRLEHSVDALQGEAHAVRARNATHDAADAQMRARLEQIAGDVQRVSRTAEQIAGEVERVGRSAEDSQQRAIVASKEAAAAVIDKAALGAHLAVKDQALKSFHDLEIDERKTKATRREGRLARRWQIAAGVLMLVLGAVVGLVAKYFEPRQQPAPTPALSR
ncbi:MAG TPA: hypothetical protein VK504_21120 [Vicinamibacterales bacterium]|nr:hypothetical protein [Vicinamibacterales bacterium]